MVGSEARRRRAQVEAGGGAGYRIPPLYDSLLAKLVVWAPTRAGAIARMRRALAETRIEGPGVATTTRFLCDVLDRPEFGDARHDTSVVEAVLPAFVDAEQHRGSGESYGAPPIVARDVPAVGWGSTVVRSR